MAAPGAGRAGEGRFPGAARCGVRAALGGRVGARGGVRPGAVVPVARGVVGSLRSGHGVIMGDLTRNQVFLRVGPGVPEIGCDGRTAALR
ncbi:hypothetical protein KNE206_28830 [Kitasatospora sp. NE20-6]